MARRGPGAGIVLLLAAAALAGCVAGDGADGGRGSGTDGAPDGWGRLEGRILDDEWMPLPRAEVTLLESGPATTRTDEDGHFVFDQLPPGTYTVATVKLGYFQKTLRLEVFAGKVTEVEVFLERVPVADPPFDDLVRFHGNVTVGTAAGGPDPVLGQGLDAVDFTLVVPATKEDGTLLAAVYTKIELRTQESPGALDLDLFFFDPEGHEIARAETSAPDEVIEHPQLLPPGDYTIRVYFWVGAAAEFTVDTTITYRQGEAAAYAIRHG